jgi:hypothetical protein
MPHLSGRYFSQVLYLRNLLDIPQHLEVLEIGSNITSVLPALSLLSKKIDFYYFDQVDSPIIKKFGGQRIGSFARPESISKKFKENSLDLIHMSHTLEHINPSSLQNMLEKCVRTLKVGGYIFIEVPFQLELENFHPPHTLFFSKKGLAFLFKNIGLNIIDLQLNNSSKKKNDSIKIDKEYQSLFNRSLNYLKTRIIKLFLIIFLKVPSVLNFIIEHKILSELDFYDHKPYLRLVGQKSSV